MFNLFDVFARAQGGAAMDMLSRQFRLTPQQTEAAVEALLPAFILGLQRMASSPEGLYKLADLTAQSAYQSLFNNPAALGRPGSEQAGNAALATLFGSPEASRAIADQAAQFAGIGTAAMHKMLPLMAAMMMGGLSQFMRAVPGGAEAFDRALKEQTAESSAQEPPRKHAPSAPKSAPEPAPEPPPRSAPRAARDETSDAAQEPRAPTAEALFDRMLDAGRDLQQAHFDNMRRILDAFAPKPDRRD